MVVSLRRGVVPVKRGVKKGKPMFGPFDESESPLATLETSLQPNPPLQAALGREVPNKVYENRLAITVASAMSKVRTQ